MLPDVDVKRHEQHLKLLELLGGTGWKKLFEDLVAGLREVDTMVVLERYSGDVGTFPRSGES